MYDPAGDPKISVGDDTPSGEPENGPKGPYITDEDDGSKSPANESAKPAGGKNRKKQRKDPAPGAVDST